MDELDERLDLVYETRTQRELDKLTADVVVPGDAQRLAVADAGEVGRRRVRVGRVRDERPRPQGPLARRAAPEGHQHHGRLAASISTTRSSTETDTTITVFSLMGGSEIRVPDNVNVVVSDFAFMGGNDAKVGEMLPDPGGPTIHIKLISIMGGSDIQRGRKLSPRRSARPSGT